MIIEFIAFCGWVMFSGCFSAILTFISCLILKRFTDIDIIINLDIVEYAFYFLWLIIVILGVKEYLDHNTLK